MRPEVMILDEPTSFLDPVSAQRIFEVVGGLNRELGLTVVLVEHRLDLATAYANRVIVMDGGEIRLNGDPPSVYASKDVQLLGIGVPKPVRLYQVLKEKGIDLDRPPLTAHEAAAMIRGLIEH
jgi:energy-coupling factor transport system ATP-binding protein